MTSQLFANLAVILSIGVLASTWFSNKLKDTESEQQLTQKTNEIKDLQTKHQGELKEKTEVIEKLQQDIILLQGVGLQKMEHQINTLTGGDSFPVIYLTADSEKTPHIYSGSLMVDLAIIQLSNSA